jgi:microcystin degradation protein MlrC
MIKSVDILQGNDCYPHVDSYERGLEAGKQMAALLQGKIKPCMSMRQIPVLCAGLSTFATPMADYLRLAHEWEQQERVVCVTLFHGFFYADVAEAGMSIVAVTDNDPELAARISNDFFDRIIANRQMFQKQATPLQESVERAMTADAGPVVLAETSDNPGGGSSGDATHLLKKLIEVKATDVGFAVIVDPIAVSQAAQAGVGAVIDVRLGGKSEAIHGEPVEARAVVRNITDGFYRNQGPMDNGLLIDAGQTAVLGIDGIDVVVCTHKLQPIDPEIFRRNGIDPLDKKILVVKSSVHFRAAYEGLASEIIEVDTPGIVSKNISNFTFRNIRRPIYPLDAE